MTERLFYSDPHLQEFEAVVVACNPSKHGFDVVLDRTAFYPEGGGQPGDTGLLGDVRVSDTHESDGTVIHWCEAPIEPGTTVHGSIDYERRFSFMQLHSGEHILSGIIHRRFGYENVGFHMGADFVTIDFNGPISAEELSDVLREANEAVWMNLPVRVSYPDPSSLQTLSYRSKKELTGQVRIVTIGDYDCCACCGTHVEYTGEIGLIAAFSCVKFHEGVRIEMLCGRKALAYLNGCFDQNRINSGLLSARPLETSEAVSRLLSEQTELKQRVSLLENQVFLFKADRLQNKGNALLIEPSMDSDSVRRLMDAVMRVCGGMAAVFSGTDRDGFKFAVGKPDEDIRAFVQRMNQTLNGRGGGRNGFAQGSVRCTEEEIHAFFEKEWKE